MKHEPVTERWIAEIQHIGNGDVDLLGVGAS